MSLQASRTTCVEPCYVLFDATGTSSTAVSDTFREVTYRWDFGAGITGTWPISGQSRRTGATGAIAAMVFPAGTHTVRVTGSDRTTSDAHREVTVTVDDQGSAFPATNTVLVSTSGTFTGSGTTGHATHAGGSSLIIQSNKRYMFRDGETFSRIAIPWGVTNVILTRYGGGSVKPVLAGLDIGEYQPPANIGRFPTKVIVDGFTFANDVLQHGSIEHLLLINCTWPSTNPANVHLYLALSTKSQAGTKIPADQIYWPRYVGIVSSSFTGNAGAFASHGILGDMTRGLGILDVTTSSYGQHNVRFGGWYKSVIAHSEVRGISNDGVRHALKLHSLGSSPYKDTLDGGITPAARYIVAAYNKFGHATDNNQWTVGISPQNVVLEEGLEDILLDSNISVRGPRVGQDLTVGGRRITYRNNKLSGGGPASVLTSAHITVGGTPSTSPAWRAAWDGPYYSD